MATEVISSIGSDGGDDYSTLQGWYDDKAGNLVTADQVQIGELRGELHTVASNEVLDMGAITSTTDATRYFHIRPMAGAFFGGDFDDMASTARLRRTGTAANTIVTRIEHTIFEGFVVDGSVAGGNGVGAVGMFMGGGNGYIRNIGVNNCFNIATTGFNGNCGGIDCSATSATVFVDNVIVNNIFLDYTGTGSGKTATSEGMTGDGDIEFRNCTVANVVVSSSASTGSTFAFGIEGGKCTNCLVMLVSAQDGPSQTALDFSGTAGGSNYNASEDTSSPGANSIDNVTPSSEVIDSSSATFDCHVKDTDADIYDAGQDLSGDFTDDIDGDTRSRWDIGADEFFASVSALTVDVNDTVTITENVTVNVEAPSLLTVNINDSITVEDGSQSVISDTVVVTEDVIVSISLLTIDISDAITVTENITVENTQLGNIDVNDSSTVTEDVIIEISVIADLSVNVNDSITITEDITTKLSDVFIGVNETVSIVEDTTVTTEVVGVLTVNVNDSVVGTESITLENTQLGNIDINDSITINELIQLLNTLFLAVNDNISIAESVSISLENFIDVNDSITTTENVTVENILTINVNDSIIVAEEVTLENTQLGDISVNDSITISEDVTTITSIEGVYQVNVSDIVNIIESVITENENLGSIDVNEGVTINENVEIFTSILLVQVVDNVTLIENIEVDKDEEISVNDSIAITEDVIVVIPVAGVLTINVNDSIISTENITVENTQLGSINVINNITINEDIISAVNISGVSIFDTIVLVESVELENQLSDVSIYDAINLTEEINSTVDNNISVNDIVVTNENIIIANTELGGINVTQAITVGEISSVSVPVFLLIINIDDTISIEEFNYVITRVVGKIIRLISEISSQINLQSEISPTVKLRSEISSSVKLKSSV